MKFNKKVLYILFSMILLVPLGLIGESPAWGEWDNAYYEKVLGFIPKGIENAEGVQSFMSDYSMKGLGSVAGYYLSAIVGTALVFGIFYLIAKVSKNAKYH